MKRFLARQTGLLPFVLAGSVLAMTACSSDDEDPSGVDADIADASTSDAAVRDTGAGDAGVPDTGMPDAGQADGGIEDAGFNLGPESVLRLFTDECISGGQYKASFINLPEGWQFVRLTPREYPFLVHSVSARFWHGTIGSGPSVQCDATGPQRVAWFVSNSITPAPEPELHTQAYTSTRTPDLGHNNLTSTITLDQQALVEDGQHLFVGFEKEPDGAPGKACVVACAHSFATADRNWIAVPADPPFDWAMESLGGEVSDFDFAAIGNVVLP